MPTYEYKCAECEEMFEVFQKMSDEPLKTCPVCGGKLVRLISGGMGVIFKGNGFYTTDYKNSSSNMKSSDSSKAEKDEGTSSSEKKKEESSQKTEKEKKESASA